MSATGICVLLAIFLDSSESLMSYDDIMDDMSFMEVSHCDRASGAGVVLTLVMFVRLSVSLPPVAPSEFSMLPLLFCRVH